jgi:hypothetical protein
VVQPWGRRKKKKNGIAAVGDIDLYYIVLRTAPRRSNTQNLNSVGDWGSSAMGCRWLLHGAQSQEGCEVVGEGGRGGGVYVELAKGLGLASARWGKPAHAAEGSGGTGAAEAEQRRLVVDSPDSDTTLDERERRMAGEDSPTRRRPVPPAASAAVSFRRREVPRVLVVSPATREGGRLMRGCIF